MLHSQRVHARRDRSTDVLFGGIAVAALLALIINQATPYLLRQLDDWRYGYPRTMHLSAAVGHEDQPGRPTKFIAVNLDRDPIIIELPGGDIEKARYLKLPRLVGADADLAPVRMTLELANADQSPDLVITIQGEEFVYINEAGNFRLINDAERAQLEAP